MKARSRIGVLYSRLPLKEVNLTLALKIFNVYVLPIYSYGLPLWMSSCSKARIEEMNSVFLKFVKRYLGISKIANNSIVHYLTGTIPLANQLQSIAPKCAESLIFPEAFHGVQLSFVSGLGEEANYNPYEKIPSWFWASKQIERLPLNAKYRREICMTLLDMNHHKFCNTETFHVKIEQSWICKLCKQRMEHYHDRYCYKEEKKQTNTKLI